jgi:CRP-like cAMP-binding protein
MNNWALGPIQRVALELASRDDGVTSAQMAKNMGTEVCHVSKMLSSYRREGLLDGDESGKRIR